MPSLIILHGVGSSFPMDFFVDPCYQLPLRLSSTIARTFNVSLPLTVWTWRISFCCFCEPLLLIDDLFLIWMLNKEFSVFVTTAHTWLWVVWPLLSTTILGSCRLWDCKISSLPPQLVVPWPGLPVKSVLGTSWPTPCGFAVKPLVTLMAFCSNVPCSFFQLLKSLNHPVTISGPRLSVCIAVLQLHSLIKWSQLAENFNIHSGYVQGSDCDQHWPVTV